MNSTDVAFRRDNFILDFLDCTCIPSREAHTQQDIADCNDAIREYECMLQYAIDVGDKKEIALSLDELLADVPRNKTIGDNLIRAWSIINNCKSTNIPNIE